MEQMSDMLSSGDMDIEDTYLVNTIGIEKYNLLFPEYTKDLEPVIPKGTKFNFNNKNTLITNNTTIKDINVDIINKPNKFNGSNNFAISPTKSKDGSSYLASQPDLSLNLPSIWYIIHLNSSNFNTMGHLFQVLQELLQDLTITLHGERPTQKETLQIGIKQNLKMVKGKSINMEING